MTLASFINPNDLLTLSGDLSDINNPKYNAMIKKAAAGLAALILVGYLSIPAAIMAGALKLIEGAK